MNTVHFPAPSVKKPIPKLEYMKPGQAFLAKHHVYPKSRLFLRTYDRIVDVENPRNQWDMMAAPAFVDINLVDLEIKVLV